MNLKVLNSHLNLHSSLLQAAAVVVCDGPLVVLWGAYVLRVLVVPVVGAAGLLGVVQELSGKHWLHLQPSRVRQVSEKALHQTQDQYTQHLRP